jgi:hypothetical protein
VKYELKIHIGIYKCIYVDEKKVQPTAWEQITVTHLKLLNTEKTDICWWNTGTEQI